MVSIRLGNSSFGQYSSSCWLASRLRLEWLLAALNVRYRDVKHAVPFLLQLWLFATPVVYPVQMIPEYMRPLAYLNPLTGIVSGFRSVSTPHYQVDWHSLHLSILVIMLLMVVSITYFSKAEETLSDIV